MSNEIVIVVKTKNETDLDPIKRSLQGIESIASKVGDSLLSGLGNAAEGAEKLGTQLGTTAAGAAATSASSTAASGGMNLLASSLTATASILPAAIAGFLALAPALLVAGGAAGAASTALAGVGISLATLAIGFGGIGTALTAHTKQMAGAGKAASDTAEQEHQAALRIRDASRAVADAKERETDAAKNVTKAIEDEIERREDLAIQLGLAKSSVAEAQQAVVEAEEKNRRAQQAGSDWEKAEAKNALDRANAELAAQKEKLGDLTKEKAKADTTSIKGSDQVQAALKRQTQAHEDVVRAQEQLTEAQRKQTVASAGATGGVNAFNDAMQKLSPNARKLVYALLGIEERFDKIKKRVQDRLLAGFDTEITNLADKWLPHLDDILGDTADHLNTFGKKVMTALGDEEFIKNIEQAGKDFDGVIDDLGDGIGDLIDAFGRLAGHSWSVLKVISGAIKGAFEWFDKWIKRADNTKKLDSFMEKAATTLQQIFDIGGLVFKVIGQVIEIIFPSSEKASKSVLDSVQDTLQKISTWLTDPKNQNQIKYFVDTLTDFLVWMVKTGIPAIAKFVKFILEVANASINAGKAVYNFGKTITSAIGNAWDWASKKTAAFFNWFSDSAHRVGAGLASMWDGLKNGFRNALNWVIGKWNNLSFPLPDIFGGPIETRNIPFLAHGGISGGLAMVGERGRELVRLPHGSSVIPNNTTENMLSRGGGGGGEYSFAFARGAGAKLMNAIIAELQLYVKNQGGGNVQVALGRGSR